MSWTASLPLGGHERIPTSASGRDSFPTPQTCFVHSRRACTQAGSHCTFQSCHSFGRSRGQSNVGPSSISCRASKGRPPVTQSAEEERQQRKAFNLEDLLGPIGLSLQALRPRKEEQEAATSSAEETPSTSAAAQGSTAPASGQAHSIHSLTTQQWRERYEGSGGVDLWVEEEFNAGSRLRGGRATHKGNEPGFGSGEGRSAGAVAAHSVTIHNHHAAQTVQVDVPEDRYILWEAEDKGLILPYACRMGCCTACAVRVKSGELHQPQSLGVSQEMKAAGYGLMCVGYPKSDLVLETVEEDEVYDQQFGQYFAQFAMDPSNRASIERDDFALEIANMDE